tara:strand:+ start:396 stop:716 length:321 start_codon:yes stop_codon:yes gene_type:complete
MATIKSTDESFKKLVKNEKKLVLTKFTAQWCSPCKAIDPILQEISEEMSNEIVIANHDIDSNPNIATEHAIRSIPTMYLWKNGEHVDTLVGGTNKSNIVSFIKKHL